MTTGWMRMLDRAACAVLLLGGAAHMIGVAKFYTGDIRAMFWAEAATFGLLLMVALNVLRALRPGDRLIAGLAAFAAAGWLAVAILCAHYLLNGWGDPRFLLHALPSLILVGFSLAATRAAMRPAGRL